MDMFNKSVERKPDVPPVKQGFYVKISTDIIENFNRNF